MLSRAGYALGRLSPAVSRGFVLRSARAISTATPLPKNDEKTEAPKPAVAGQRGGLTGFLQEKTGVTGAWTLGAGLTAYILSKEIYIINSETVVGVILFGVIYYLVKKIGQPTAQFLDERSAGILSQFNEGRVTMAKGLEESIAAENSIETMLECRKDVFDVLRENNTMRMEEEYRRRMHQVSQTVRRQLDYQVDVEKLHRSFEHEHLVSWLERMVTENIKGKQDESLSQCMADMKKMQAAA